MGRLINKILSAFILLLLIVGVAVSDRNPDITLSDFTGGLNTEYSAIRLQPNEASICTNWDLSKLGLTKRRGYRALYTHDSTLRAFYAFYTPESKKLIGVYDNSDINGLGVMTSSDIYQYDLNYDTLGYRYIYTGVPPYWTTWRGEVIMSNGRQRPLIYLMRGASDYHVKELVLPAPGEPLIVPIHDSGAYLNGTYRYATEIRGYCGTESFGSNELDNGDFETWTDTTTPGGSWEGTITDFGNIYSDNTDELNGSWCMRIEANGTPAYKGWSAVFDTMTGLTSEAQYRLSAYFKSPNSGTGYKGLLMVKNTNGDFIATKYCDLTTSYAYDEVYFTKPVSYDVVVYVGLYCPNKLGCTDLDTLYVDSVVVEGLSSTFSYRESYVSQPVLANNEKMMLTGLIYPSTSNACADLDDTVNVKIYRTKANPGELSQSDKFYLVLNEVYSKTNIDTLKIIDSLTDDDIDSMAVHYIDTVSRGRDATTDTVELRVGAPTYYGRNDTTVNIFNVPFTDSAGPIAMSYICTYYDTLSDIESDSSRSLYVAYSADTSDTNYTLGLPRIPSRLSHTIRKIYRSYTYWQSRTVDSIGDEIMDTSLTVGVITNGWNTKNVQTTYFEAQAAIQRLVKQQRFIKIDPEWTSNFGEYLKKYGKNTQIYTITCYALNDSSGQTRDTLTTSYHLIDVIEDSSDSTYLDIVPFDSMMRGQIYARLGAPHNLNHITAFQDRLWGSVGSVLYWSFLDSAGYWGSLRNLVLNDDDGDEITAIMPTKDYVKVYKNKVSYIVDPDGDGYSRAIQTQAFGCIAPRSMRQYNDANIYLSDRGVIYETGSPQLWNGVQSVAISSKINSLILNRPTSEKKDMIGAVYEGKYLLSMPGKDTTFVCFLNVAGYPWAIWTMDFWQTTYYDTASVTGRTPSNDMLFINGEDSSFYLIDTTFSDAGDSIDTHYRTPLLMPSYDTWELERLGMYRFSSDNGLCVRLYNENGDSVNYLYYPDSIANKKGFSMNEYRGFQVDIRDSTTGLDSLRLERIDIWTRNKGDKNTQ